MSPHSDKYRREKEKAKMLRACLIEALGDKCDECGATRELEVDHVNGRDWCARQLSLRQRVHRYYTEYLSGVRLRVLCKSCNSKDGAMRRWFNPPPKERPCPTPF